ncbi:probable calcium-binding protein CML46 [Lactuca sativa]|uniref:probable calcium-binding protein CML46 n=1 Tax=Lactuca sativa TaxID=4236 RepID=UPI000CB529EC|nr:probable calcium-binding protein CML46 [Lactuca sativa]
MDVTHLKKNSTSILLGFGIAFCDMNIYEVMFKPLRASIQSLLTHVSISWNKLRTTATSHDQKEITSKVFVTFREINMVMTQLGFQQCCGEEGSIDILSVFDEEEPSMGEVKVAFDMFDENSDGFIDEFELQRMLCKFGQPENENLEKCRNMIKGFDLNGDGVIDFEEFVRLMETCF